MQIERVQTGVRLEKRVLKVLKGLAELHDRSLGEMLEVILLHSFENAKPFTTETLKAIGDLKRVYKLDYDVHDYKEFIEKHE